MNERRGKPSTGRKSTTTKMSKPIRPIASSPSKNLSPLSTSFSIRSSLVKSRSKKNSSRSAHLRILETTAKLLTIERKTTPLCLTKLMTSLAASKKTFCPEKI